MRWIVFALFISVSVAGYYLTKEEARDGALQVVLVEHEAPASVAQPTQTQEGLRQRALRDENQALEIDVLSQAEVQARMPQEEVSLDENAMLPTLPQEEVPLDESTLPSGLPPEDAFLSPDDTGMFVGNVDAVPVDHGEALDPDMEDYPQISSMGDEHVEDVGEFIDPDWDVSSMASEAATTPRHIGPFIDPDNEEATIIVQDTPEEVVNIGEYIDPNYNPTFQTMDVMQ